MALAERAGLGELTAEHVRMSRPCRVNAQVKVGCLVAGVIAEAGQYQGHGSAAIRRHAGGVWRAAGTVHAGVVLAAVHLGERAAVGKVHREVLAELARRAPQLPGADVLAFLDIASPQKRVYGHAKQGVAFGFTKIQGKGLAVRGLNVLAAPVIAATRLRGGNASSARGAASMIIEAVATAYAAGCTGTLVVRMDSAFYGTPACSAARKARAHFSVTVRMDPKSVPRSPLPAAVGHVAMTNALNRPRQAVLARQQPPSPRDAPKRHDRAALSMTTGRAEQVRF